MTLHTNLSRAFEVVVQQHGQRCALHYPASGERISYTQLHALSQHLAGLLHDRGLRRGQVIALLHDKSPAAFAMMLACLRLGLVYTNLDPGSPWERVRKILQACQPALVAGGFSELPFQSELQAAGHATLHLQACADAAAPAAPLPAIEEPDGGAPAYIMFTSGSTGSPKGAVMSHANVLWFLNWARERFAIVAGDVFSNVNPMYFDNSVFDFYAAIWHGATMVPVSSEQVRDTRLVVRLLNDAGCSVWFSVPSMLVYLLITRALKPTDWPALRLAIFGGEGFPKTRLRQLYELFGQRAMLENVYGPTECTCICSAYAITAADFDDMQNLAPLGYLAHNFDYEILATDADDPDSGELFLRGPQVGLGYYNDTQRSAGVFIQNPRHQLYADRGYRTGDLVKRDAQGVLHFKGRVDFQVKHMGYRIELEEIEAALGSIACVLECAVIYQKSATDGGQILAFARLDPTADAALLPAALATLVPPYMMPRSIAALSALPKNANGKIDRLALSTLASKGSP